VCRCYKSRLYSVKNDDIGLDSRPSRAAGKRRDVGVVGIHPHAGIAIPVISDEVAPVDRTTDASLYSGDFPSLMKRSNSRGISTEMLGFSHYRQNYVS
jgi:hypothetical protein